MSLRVAFLPSYKPFSVQSRQCVDRCKCTVQNENRKIVCRWLDWSGREHSCNGTSVRWALMLGDYAWVSVVVQRMLVHMLLERAVGVFVWVRECWAGSDIKKDVGSCADHCTGRRGVGLVAWHMELCIFASVCLVSCSPSCLPQRSSVQFARCLRKNLAVAPSFLRPP